MSLPPDDWLPFYPDRPSRPRRLLAPFLADQPPYTVDIFPVTDVLASLTFLPSFPDRVPHPTTLREQTDASAASWDQGGLYPLIWKSTYPDQVPDQRLSIGLYPAGTAPPPGTQVVIAQRLSWQARFPDQVPHRQLRPLGGLDWAIDPSIPAATVGCVDLALDTLDAPVLATEALTAPTLLSEGLDSPTLLGEDLC